MSEDIEKEEGAQSLDIASVSTYISELLLKMDEITSFAQVGLTDAVREDIFRIDIQGKGIRITEHEDAGGIIDLFLNVRFGVRIPELAWEIQRLVKRDVEDVFETKIESVNVHVQGVE